MCPRTPSPPAPRQDHGISRRLQEEADRSAYAAAGTGHEGDFAVVHYVHFVPS